MVKVERPESLSIPKELLFAALAIISVGLLVFELTQDLMEEQRKWLTALDLTIAGLFLTYFIIGIARANDRKRFFRERWYELIASIPFPVTTLQALRPLRIIRVIRIIRLAARLKRVADSTVDGAAFQLLNLFLIVTTIVFAGAVAFFEFEQASNPQVKTLFDAFWWAMVTSTTVGYGDISPITTEGRISAMLLMLVGIGTVGSVIAILTNRFTNTESR